MWLSILLACTSTSPQAVSEVSWAMDWRHEAAQIGPDGVHLTTDQGVRVHLEEGYLVTWSAALVPCPQPQRSWSLIATAEAAHAYEDDPSAIEPQHAEPLHQPGPVELGTRSMPATAYCQSHMLWAKARADAPVPRDDLIGRSLRIHGSWDDGSGPHPLAIDAAWAHANQLPLELPEHPTGKLRAVAHRDLDRLFDGIDFRTANDNQVAWKVLDNLARYTTWTLEWQP